MDDSLALIEIAQGRIKAAHERLQDALSRMDTDSTKYSRKLARNAVESVRLELSDAAILCKEPGK